MHMSRMREMRNAYKVYVENMKARRHLVDLSVDGGTILKLVVKNSAC
jgi:hypothetical protein